MIYQYVSLQRTIKQMSSGDGNLGLLETFQAEILPCVTVPLIAVRC